MMADCRAVTAQLSRRRGEEGRGVALDSELRGRG